MIWLESGILLAVVLGGIWIWICAVGLQSSPPDLD
jgi:hypothetical protein